MMPINGGMNLPPGMGALGTSSNDHRLDSVTQMLD